MCISGPSPQPRSHPPLFLWPETNRPMLTSWLLSKQGKTSSTRQVIYTRTHTHTHTHTKQEIIHKLSSHTVWFWIHAALWWCDKTWQLKNLLKIKSGSLLLFLAFEHDEQRTSLLVTSHNSVIFTQTGLTKHSHPQSSLTFSSSAPQTDWPLAPTARCPNLFHRGSDLIMY